MSRVLPAQPNLDHLKKQAKELLREMEQRNPDSKLADAQHTIALEYGFASWPTLKAHVDSLSRPAGLAQASVGSLLVGNWTANPSKSKQHPDRRIRGATLQFAVVGDTVTITDVVVDASGQQEHTNTIQADGKEHRSGQSPRYAVVAHWRSSHALDVVATKDGQLEGRVTYEASADGKTLTVTARATSGTDVEQVGVFDRT